MAGKKPDKPEPPKGSGSKLKLILLILIVLLVLGGAGGAAYYFLIYKAADPAGEATEGHTATEEHQEPAPEHQPKKEAAPAGEHAAGEHTQIIYHPLEPITVNLTTPGSVRFLRISLTIVTRNPLVTAAIDKHLPMIRNDLLAHFSSLDAAVVNTPEGKAALREELRNMISAILVRAGEPGGIQDILFTDLVMQ